MEIQRLFGVRTYAFQVTIRRGKKARNAMGHSFPTTHDDDDHDGLSLSYLLSPRRYPRERPPQSQRLEVGVRRDRFARLIVALDDALEQSLPGV